MKLKPSQCQYLLIGQSVIPAIVNFILNGVIVFFAFRNVDPIPTWGFSSSAVADIVGTCFLLPAITCLIVTPIVRFHVRVGTVMPIGKSSGFPAWSRPFQCRLDHRAVRFGLVFAILMGGLAVFSFYVLDRPHIPNQPFVWFKALFSGVLGAMVTPLIALVALAEKPSTGHD